MLRRRPDGFSEVLKVWQGDVVAILGCGPSLTKEQCEFVRGKCRVIAVNNAYLLAPWADILYFPDRRWLVDFKNGEREDFKAFLGHKVTIEQLGNTPGDARFHLLRNMDLRGQAEGLSDDPAGLVSGRHSVYQAIGLAVHAGAIRIVLLGCDYRHVNGKDHFDGGGHPMRTEDETLRFFTSKFRLMPAALKARGVEVLNATEGSRLEVFPRVSLNSIL